MAEPYVCTPCQAGNHDECVDNEFVHDMSQIMPRFCWCPCQDDESDASTKGDGDE